MKKILRSFKLNPVVDQELIEEAAKNDVTVSEVIRQKVSSIKRLNLKEMQEFKNELFNLNYQLRMLGNNLNQTVTIFNKTGMISNEDIIKSHTELMSAFFNLDLKLNEVLLKLILNSSK